MKVEPEKIPNMDEYLSDLKVKLQKDPNYELMIEFGAMLLRDINSLTKEERKRYEVLRIMLSK